MDIQDEKEVVKRQLPFTAMGGSVCSYCIIEKSKNIIGLEMPDILTLPEHDEMMSILEVNQADELAAQCLTTIAKKVGLSEDSLTYCKLSNLENQQSFGSLFVGLTIQKIKPDENMIQFKERVIETYQKLGLMGVEFDNNDGETNERQLSETTQIGLVNDIYFFYTEKEHEDDTDDYDDGSEDGYENGSAVEHYLSKVAIYRCLKNRKMKEVDTFLEDFDAAMENFKADNGFLAKWTKKYQEEIKDEE